MEIWITTILNCIFILTNELEVLSFKFKLVNYFHFTDHFPIKMKYAFSDYLSYCNTALKKQNKQHMFIHKKEMEIRLEGILLSINYGLSAESGYLNFLEV